MKYIIVLAISGLFLTSCIYRYDATKKDVAYIAEVREDLVLHQPVILHIEKDMHKTLRPGILNEVKQSGYFKNIISLDGRIPVGTLRFNVMVSSKDAPSETLGKVLTNAFTYGLSDTMTGSAYEHMLNIAVYDGSTFIGRYRPTTIQRARPVFLVVPMVSEASVVKLLLPKALEMFKAEHPSYFYR